MSTFVPLSSDMARQHPQTGVSSAQPGPTTCRAPGGFQGGFMQALAPCEGCITSSSWLPPLEPDKWPWVLSVTRKRKANPCKFLFFYFLFLNPWGKWKCAVMCFLAWCLLQGVQREDPHSPHSPSSCGSQGLSLAFWRLKQPLSAPPPGLGPLQALRASWALGMAVQSRNDSGPARMPSSVPGTGQYSEKCDSGPR